MLADAGYDVVEAAPRLREAADAWLQLTTHEVDDAGRCRGHQW
jgi:amidase